MILTLDEQHEARYASWNVTLHKMLASSGRFTVRHEPLPRITDRSGGRIAGRVSPNFSAFKIDGRLIVLDTWDTDSPTVNCWKAGYFSPGGMFADAALVLKIQWEPKPIWQQFTEETGKTITPWTMFPSREFPLEWFRWQAHGPHLYLATLTGAERFGRGAFKDIAQHWPNIYSKPRGQKDPIADYLRILETCKWGVSLVGKRGTQNKNRREVEFASCGMPLALNYIPSYPFPFQPGTHFVFLKEPRDLSRLATMDPRPFAERSIALWRDHFCPVAMADKLLTLLDGMKPYGLSGGDQKAAG